VKTGYDPRYSLVACAFVIQGVMVGSLFAYGILFNALESELAWSRTALSASFSVSVVVMGISGIVLGRLNDRFGPRPVMRGAAICFAVGYSLMFYMESAWQLLVLYGLLVGIGMGGHDVLTLSTVARRFHRRRGLMTGITKVGTACGQITIPIGVSLVVVTHGWRAATLTIGLVALALLLGAAQGLRDKIIEDAPVATEPNAPNAIGISLAQAVRTRAFWIFCGAQACFIPCLTTIPVHIVPHAVDLGMSTTTAALLLSVIGAFSILGRLLVGFGSDRIGGRRAMLLCFCILLLSMLALRFSETASFLFAIAAVYGVCHGGFFTVVSPVIAEYFGTASHGAIFGVVLFAGTLGGAVGPLLAGHSFDTFDSYDLAFVTLAGLAALGLSLVTWLGSAARTEPESA